jgi:hypothetical protein
MQRHAVPEGLCLLTTPTGPGWSEPVTDSGPPVVIAGRQCDRERAVTGLDVDFRPICACLPDPPEVRQAASVSQSAPTPAEEKQEWTCEKKLATILVLEILPAVRPERPGEIERRPAQRINGDVDFLCDRAPGVDRESPSSPACVGSCTGLHWPRPGELCLFVTETRVLLSMGPRSYCYR